MPMTVIDVVLLVTGSLERLGARYLLVGSFASANYGVYRTTADADILADLRLEHAEPLAQALLASFYVDVESIREAVQRRRSLNVIHLELGFKVDIFMPKARPFDRKQLERRVLQMIGARGEHSAYFASAEDTTLAKLEWHRQGGEVSERQWLDVLGILKVQGEALDLAYMHEWAQNLAVSDLLIRALEQAGFPQGFAQTQDSLGPLST
jgi:hypothetical protein